MSATLDKQKRLEFYIQKIEGVPSMPAVVLELFKLIDNPMTSTNKIEELLSRDQGLTLKTLRLANSAYYAIPGGAKTLSRAITFLGFNTLKQLLLTSSLFEAFNKLDAAPTFRILDFWKHSIGTAIVAETLAKKLQFISSEEVFICGLIHDVGKLVLLMIDKKEFVETCMIAKEKKISFHQVELSRDVPLHTFCGQLLAKKWRLPDLLQITIKEHHSPNLKTRSNPDPEINQVVDLIFISNQIVHFLNYGNSGYDQVPEINSEIATRLGLKMDEMEVWMKPVKDSLAMADAMIQDLVKTNA